VRVVLGDSRIFLEKVPDRLYGMLVLDAFSADAVPVHLLTREAVQLYLSKLVDHGILVFHISSRYLDLQKVLGHVASDAGLVAMVENDTTDIQAGKLPFRWLVMARLRWLVMARNKDDLGNLVGDLRWNSLKGDPRSRVWTDDYSNFKCPVGASSDHNRELDATESPVNTTLLCETFLHQDTAGAKRREFRAIGA
jgi:hypothetical protein